MPELIYTCSTPLNTQLSDVLVLECDENICNLFIQVHSKESFVICTGTCMHTTSTVCDDEYTNIIIHSDIGNSV